MASFRSLSWRRCRMQSYIRWPCVVPDDVSTPTTPELPPRGRTLMFCQRFAVVTISVPATLAHCVLLAGHRNGQRPSLPGVCRPSCPMHNMVGDVQAQTEGRPPSDIRHPLSRWYVKFYPSHASEVLVANAVIGTIYFVFVARFSTCSRDLTSHNPRAQLLLNAIYLVSVLVSVSILSHAPGSDDALTSSEFVVPPTSLAFSMPKISTASCQCISDRAFHLQNPDVPRGYKVSFSRMIVPLEQRRSSSRISCSTSSKRACGRYTSLE